MIRYLEMSLDQNSCYFKGLIFSCKSVSFAYFNFSNMATDGWFNPLIFKASTVESPLSFFLLLDTVLLGRKRDFDASSAILLWKLLFRVLF